MPGKTPLILYLKRNCLDDGTGIRTLVFFKGCPLSCVWCHNPESRRLSAELSGNPDKCVGCLSCMAVCQRKAISFGDDGFEINRKKCNLCFDCARECPSGALERLGVEKSVAEIVEFIEQDVPFFKTSGGGATLSGGEPTMHMDFCSGLLAELKAKNINTLLETCGLFDFEIFSKKMMPHLDAIYMDVKLIDEAAHKKYCGVSNATILENVIRVHEASQAGGPEFLPRVPLVPGITDTDANMFGIADFLRSNGITRISLLPYNPTWPKKAGMIGDVPEYTHNKWMPQEELDRCRAHFADFKIV